VPASILSSWGLVLLFTLAAAVRAVFLPARGRDVLFFACAAFGAHAALYWPLTVDDSFITFRFARSWIEGVGPIYQPGSHVEGFTSFGWMALLALAGRLGLDVVLAAKVIGMLAAASTLPAAHAIALRLTGRPRLALAAALVLALNPLFAAWSVAGMEAPLFAALVAWGVWARLENRTVAGVPLDAALFGLSVWIRPEGFLFGTVVFLALLLERRPGTARAATYWAFTATTFALPFWGWRWGYYGAFFPNTFYAKMPDLQLRLAAGARALLDFAIELGPWVWIPLLASLARLRSPAAPERFPWFVLACFFAYVGWTGGDVLHLRFFVHVLPLVMALWAAGLDTLLSPLAARLRPARAPSKRVTAPRPTPIRVRVLLAVVLVAAGCALGMFRDRRAFGSRVQFGPGYVVNNARNVSEVNLPLGRWLHDHAPPGSRVATWDIGGIGWTSRLPILDLYGLTDVAIAHLIHDHAPVSSRIHYLLAARPELLVTYARVNGPDWSWLTPAADSLMAHYHYHSLWQATSSGYWLVLLARDDIALPPAPHMAMVAPDDAVPAETTP
jgi:hypothetical protein